MLVVVASLLLPATVAAQDPSARPSPSGSTVDAPPTPMLTSPPPTLSDPSAEPSIEPDPPPSAEPADPAPSSTPGRSGVAAQRAAAAGTPIATTTAASIPSPSVIYQGATFLLRAVVDPVPAPTMVMFYIDGSFTGAAYTDATTGMAEITSDWSSPGQHTMRAEAGMTSSHAGSTSAPVTFTVLPFGVTLTSDTPTAGRGEPVTFVLDVVPNPGGGVVDWYVDVGVVATTPVDADGRATYVHTFDTAGDHWVGGTFTGTGLFPRAGKGQYQKVVGDTSELTVDVEEVYPEGPVSVVATVTPNPGGGTISYDRGPGTTTSEASVDADGRAILDLGNRSVGTTTWQARYLGNAIVAPATTTFSISVKIVIGTSLATDRATAVRGERPVVLTAVMACARCHDPYHLPGVVRFRDIVNGVSVDLGPVTADPIDRVARLSVNSLRVGSHSIVAIFEPTDDSFLDSTSPPVTITVLADSAVAATFTRSRSTIYPYKDGFRDTVSLSGRLEERASVGIKVYDPAGRLRRSWSLGTRNAGTYAVTWNGRTSSGGSLASGRYRAVATIKDVAGHSRTYALFVTLSTRKARWIQATTTRYGIDGAFVVDSGGLGKLYYSPDYTDGVILDSGPMIRDCTGCGYAAGRYVFGLRSNGLDYRYISVQVKGHGFSDREHPGSVSITDPATKQFVLTRSNCEFDSPGLVCGTSVPVKYISSAKRIEAWVWMTQAWGDAYDLAFVRVKYQYAVLV